MTNSDSYDDISKKVIERHDELQTNGESDIIRKLRREFQLSTSVIFEILGLEDHDE